MHETISRIFFLTSFRPVSVPSRMTSRRGAPIDFESLSDAEKAAVEHLAEWYLAQFRQRGFLVLESREVDAEAVQWATKASRRTVQEWRGQPNRPPCRTYRRRIALYPILGLATYLHLKSRITSRAKRPVADDTASREGSQRTGGSRGNRD